MKIQWNKVRIYLHGLVATMIGASLTAIGGMIVTPDITLHQLGKIALFAGIVSAAGYLSPSPKQRDREKE